MSHRHTTTARFIDPTQPVTFTFNGKSYAGFQGDTLASALLANGQCLMGRSFKYHRPRGAVTAGVEEPNALVNLGRGAKSEPNQRATTTEIFNDLTASSQNHWPSLDYDIGALNAAVSRFLPAGFYYKTFMKPRAAWQHLFEPLIRQAAGLGPAPTERDADHYEHFHAFCDVLVVGGGVAGLAAALQAAETGARVILFEQSPHWGGRAPVDCADIDGIAPEEWVAQTLARLAELPNVTLRNRTTGAGVYDHGYAVGLEQVTDHAPTTPGPRHRLWRVRATRIVTTTGAIERPLVFAGNDLPGVMLAASLRDYLVNYGVLMGKTPVIATNNDDAYATALALATAGGTGVPVTVLDARATPQGPLYEAAKSKGIQILPNTTVAATHGRKTITAVTLCAADGDGTPTGKIACDALGMSGGWSPVVHLWSHCGGKLRWDATQSLLRPDPDHPPTGDDGAGFVLAAGAANGFYDPDDARADARAAGQRAAKEAGFTPSDAAAPAPTPAPNATPLMIDPAWILPHKASAKMRAKMWLDFQNDVKASDVQLAAQEGYHSVEHTKRYTTLGMATDQGKLSNINGLAVLSDALGQDIPAVGTTTFRPPYTPISMGAISGSAVGSRFQPIRKTPLHSWHADHNAHWEPVGAWRRPYCYPAPGETHADAVTREVKNTRNNLGLLDASTLGKIHVQGPDAGKFLDLIYTNKMSTLKPGHCRYGLICNENGFLIDDGVVACLGDNEYLCHTTTGGADTIHAHMEFWLQAEWWDFQVYTANVTEQFGQIAVVGPNARRLLERLGGMDVSAENLPFMRWVEGRLGAYDARVFRISFSGELSYEIAVPASQTMALWCELVDLGKDFGAMPYGTEALHVLRAEKGFIMIGDETDGTIIPQDLGLSWAISKKKDDFIGMRAHKRAHMQDPTRWKMVGLTALDGQTLPEGGYILDHGTNENGQRNMQGRITSTYYSPTLDQSIALALLRHGPERLGEKITIGGLGGDIEARVVDPVFYDKEGEKQNV